MKKKRNNKVDRGKEKKNSANIPSRNLIVHDLPYVGGDLPVSLVAIHLGHYTHLNVNILSLTHSLSLRMEATGRYKGEYSMGDGR